MFPLAKEKRGRRQGSTSKEITLKLILFLGPLVPLLLVNEEAGGREAPATN